MTSLALLLAGVLMVSLNLYALGAGADFGGGVWDMLASGRRERAQRDTIAHAIGPIWEANHVWLILVIVVLFVAFPVAFAALATALHIPLTLMLIGVVLPVGRNCRMPKSGNTTSSEQGDVSRRSKSNRTGSPAGTLINAGS